MHAGTNRLEFAPPPTPGMLRSFGLAVLAHLFLLAALTWGVQWKSEAVTVAAEAELWSAVPQEAAPKLVELPPERPQPQKAPVVKPTPKPPTPPPPPQVQPKLPDPNIALEREKLRLKKEKQQELETQRLEKLKLEKAEKLKQEKLDKLKQGKLQLEKKKLQDKRDQEQKVIDENKKKLAQETKRKDALEAQQEAKMLDAMRKENLKRIAGLAGATGSANSQGKALQSSGPSANYAGRIRASVKPNIVFVDEIVGNPKAEVEVGLAPDGTIISRKLSKSSGDKSWDDAVIRALDKTGKLPRDVDGRIISPLTLVFRPKD